MKRVFEESWKGVVGESCWRRVFEEGLKRVGRELLKRVVGESF